MYDAIYHKDFFHSHDTSKNQEVRVPETAIIALEVYDGALIAPYYGDYDKGDQARFAQLNLVNVKTARNFVK